MSSGRPSVAEQLVDRSRCVRPARPGLLRAELYDFELAKHEAKAAEDAKARLEIEWGSQIRSYVLFPYQQVNDHRTEVKTSDVDGVLDGDLDDLIRTYLLKSADAPTRPS